MDQCLLPEGHPRTWGPLILLNEANSTWPTKSGGGERGGVCRLLGPIYLQVSLLRKQGKGMYICLRQKK